MPRARWLARMGDPWSNNPYLMRIPPFPLVDRYLERRLFDAADFIGMPSLEMVDFVRGRESESIRNKFFVLPQCYDEALYPAPRREINIVAPDAPYVIRSLGKCYGPRSPEPFFRAIEQVAQREPALLDQVRIEFYGGMGSYAACLDRYPAAKRCIALCGNVPYRESLRLMREADCLLTIDAPCEHNVFFPSKLAEYVGAGAFLVALTPAGATARVMTEHGGLWADPADSAACVAMCDRLFRDRPRIAHGPSELYAREQVQQALVDRLIR